MGNVVHKGSSSAPHSLLTEDQLHPPFSYEQDTDPGAVGAGLYWLDTSSSPMGISRRNSTDTGWDSVGTAGGGGGAPTTAKYITQTADAGLSAEQALSALATGLVKVTTTTGVLSTATQGTDYYAPSGTDVAVVDGGTGASSASAARTNLGLGSVDNTSDAGKPISTLTQSALDLKQPLDADLTTIAGLTPTTGNVVQSVAGAWSSQTPAQVKTSLVLVKGDVGLGSVDNTSDASKPISTLTQSALDLKQPLDADLTTIAGLTPTTDNFMVAASNLWASRTPAQAKTSLALAKADVGLGSVDNTSDAGKPVSTAQQTALDLKAPVAAKYLVQTADATLTAEQALGALATGIMKNTTATGVVSIAVGADLPTHTHAEADTTNLVSDLAAKATSGAALTEAAEANSTPVAGATSTALGTGIRVFAFFTLPTTEKWYVITGIEWLNKATVNGNVWCGVDRVDANPPVLPGTVNVAVGARLVQTGANAAQRNSQIGSYAIRGGTILGVWFVSDSATATFGNTAVGSANNRKTIAAGTPVLADATAWTASTAGYYVKCYYQGIK